MSEYYDWHPEEFPKPIPLSLRRTAERMQSMLIRHSNHIFMLAMGTALLNLALGPKDEPSDTVSTVPVLVMCDAYPGVDTDTQTIPYIPGDLGAEIERRLADDGLDVDEPSCMAVSLSEQDNKIVLQPGKQSITYVADSCTVIVRTDVTPQN